MKEIKYLSKEYTNCLRGIFAILVVIHHLYQYTGLLRQSYLGAILQLCGFLSVSVFFFLSGYGLMLSSKKANYVDQFLRTRFLPLYCFYIILIILYSLWTLILEKSCSPKEIIQSFFWGGTVVTNGWYLQATFISYLFYYFSFNVFSKAKLQLLSFGLFIFAYCIFCHLIGLGSNWYQTIPCMFLGMLFSYKKADIDEIFDKHIWIIFIASSLSFVICLLLSKLSSIEAVFTTLYLMFFVCSTVALSYLLYNTSLINNYFFALCGNYSLEIYVSHGFFLRLIKLNYIENILIYILVVVVGTILTSIILKLIYTKITVYSQVLYVTNVYSK